jgi:DMSO/TMAO reductase YedYZ molybdopterin-dependent catalytic subunit
MSFWMDKTKEQSDDIPLPPEALPGVIVSPDTRRGERIPPGQSRTKKWPVLDAGGPPQIDMTRWTLRIHGLVAQPVEWSWEIRGKAYRPAN